MCFSIEHYKQSEIKYGSDKKKLYIKAKSINLAFLISDNLVVIIAEGCHFFCAISLCGIFDTFSIDKYQ